MKSHVDIKSVDDVDKKVFLYCFFGMLQSGWNDLNLLWILQS